ncbi:MAG: hypothetical protein IJT34_04105, partial [Butyrivibrio sp.]|nr:hypothetical protein [Butyrivibrio sp.]
LYAVYRFLRSLYRLNEFQAGITGAFFLFFHYFIFASLDADNLHLLYIYDLTNCFNYMLPTMLNIALILFLARCERDGNRLLSGSPLLRAGIYLLVYLAVFSHLFSGYLLAIYAAIHIAYRLFFQKKREGLIPYALILLMFGLSMLLESRGMRSENIDQSFALGLTLSVLARRLWHVKKLFVLISVLLIGGASFVWYRDRKKNGKEDNGVSTVYIRVMAGCAIFVPLSMIWIVLLCAASNAMYVQRMDVLLAPAVFYILAVTNAIAFLLRRYPRAITITPLALYIGIAMIWSVEGRSFLGEENPEGWIALENHHIEQFVEADQAGKKSVTLELTDIYEEKWMGDRIARTLYKHGITSRQLKVHPVHSAELKDRYQLKTPQMPWRD